MGGKLVSSSILGVQRMAIGMLKVYVVKDLFLPSTTSIVDERNGTNPSALRPSSTIKMQLEGNLSSMARP